MEAIRERIEYLENELWYIEMADRLTIQERRQKEAYERELAELRERIRG